MAENLTLVDLRNDIQAIVSELIRQDGQGEFAVKDAVKLLRERHLDSIEQLTTQLINLTLEKLVHEVGRRKRPRPVLTGTLNLFSNYPGIPATVTIDRGKKKDFTRLTIKEVKLWLETKDHRTDKLNREYEQVAAMLSSLEKYSEDQNDTLEDMARRKQAAKEREQLDLKLEE